MSLEAAKIRSSVLIKREDASDHEMYIVRDLSRIPQVLSEHFVNSFHSQPKETVLVQRLLGHYNCCFKVYVFFCKPYLQLRKSLPTEMLQLDSKDWLTPISEVSADPFSANPMEAIPRLCLASLDFLQFLCLQFYKIAQISCFCLDIIVDEITQDFYLIDLNDFPTFKEDTGDLIQELSSFWTLIESENCNKQN